MNGCKKTNIKGNKLYLSFIVDYAHAKAFRAKKGYNQAPKHREDIRVEVFIQKNHTRQREISAGFLSTIEDAKKGKFDLIVTREV